VTKTRSGNEPMHAVRLTHFLNIDYFLKIDCAGSRETREQERDRRSR
jgi:hypothetical protein